MKKKQTIKVSYCIAYDWNLLEYSLPLIYDYADIICLAIDKDRMSWSLSPFEFDSAAFDSFVKKLDIDNKIKIYEDDFHQSNLTPMENEVRQRNLMAEFIGKEEGWHIQLDCDEYFLNFEGFVEYLQNLSTTDSQLTNIWCPIITLFKQIDQNFLYIHAEIEKQIEYCPLAMIKPCYQNGRRNGYFNHYAPFIILHQSWARSSNEIQQKLNNWGHSKDFDGQKFFDTWNNLSKNNYKELTNFHPIEPSVWRELKIIPANNCLELITTFEQKFEGLPINSFNMWINNKKNYSRIKKLFSYLKIN